MPHTYMRVPHTSELSEHGTPRIPQASLAAVCRIAAAAARSFSPGRMTKVLQAAGHAMTGNATLGVRALREDYCKPSNRAEPPAERALRGSAFQKTRVLRGARYHYFRL